MDYLSETTAIYGVEINSQLHSFEHDEVEHEESGEVLGKVYNQYYPLDVVSTRPARWWTVGVYTACQRYGGPEEGGWYYTAGHLVEHGRMRFFASYEEARVYQTALWAWVENENKARRGWDEQLTVRSTTESLPSEYYPLKRPHYS